MSPDWVRPDAPHPHRRCGRPDRRARPPDPARDPAATSSSTRRSGCGLICSRLLGSGSAVGLGQRLGIVAQRCGDRRAGRRADRHGACRRRPSWSGREAARIGMNSSSASIGPGVVGHRLERVGIGCSRHDGRWAGRRCPTSWVRPGEARPARRCGRLAGARCRLAAIGVRHGPGVRRFAARRAPPHRRGRHLGDLDDHAGPLGAFRHDRRRVQVR
jgi:hypothetical protein